MNANEMYAVKQDSVARKLKELESRIKKHAKDQESNSYNWEFVGDLTDVEVHLNNILSFLGK